MGQHNAEWLGSPDCNFKPFNFIRQSPLDLARPTALWTPWRVIHRCFLQLIAIKNALAVRGSYRGTPVLVTRFSKGLGTWKIPSQGVWGRSRDFRNVSNEIVGLALFEIWNMGYLVRVLGDPPKISGGLQIP